MRTLCYAAAVCAASLSISTVAVAQEAVSDDDETWFEPEAPTETEPSVDAPAIEAEVPRATPPPKAETRREVRVERTAGDHEHDGCDFRRGKHRHKRPRGSRSLSVIGGGMRLDAPELTDALAGAGFAEPSKLRFVGLQGTRVLPRRLVLGLGVNVGWSEELERDDGASGRLLLMQLRGQLGYALVHTDKWLLYPAFEVGLNHLELDLGAGGSTSFDDALAAPRSGSELERNSLSVGGVVAIERRFPIRWRRNDDWARFFSIGLRAGWMRDLVASPWKVDGDDDVRGPEERQAIKYIGVTVGFGHARF